MKVTINKRGLILYLILLILSLVFTSFYGGPVSYGVFYALLLLLPLSILYTILNYNLLHIYQEIEVHKLVRGESYSYRVLFENTSVFPVYKMGIYLFSDRCRLSDIKDGERISLDSREKKELISRITCMYAGAYNVGLERISLTDAFGLYEVVLTVPYTFRAIVKPQITDAATEVIEVENLFNSLGLKSDNVYEDIPGSDIRPYQRGDSLNTINWKASAKQDELMVRLPDTIENRTVTLLLLAANEDENKYNIDFIKRRDYFLEFAVSAAWHFGIKEIPLRIIYPSGHITEFIVNSYETFLEFYNLIADGLFYSSNQIYEEISRMSKEQRGGSYENETWIIIKENPNPEEHFVTICE